MRIFYSICILAFSFSACNPGNTGDSNADDKRPPERYLPFEAKDVNDPKLKELYDEWLCISVEPRTPDRKAEISVERAIDKLKNAEEFNVLRFAEDGTLSNTDYKAMHKRWAFEPPNHIYFPQRDYYPANIIDKLDKDTLRLITKIVSEDKRDTAIVHSNFLRVDSKKAGQTDIFDPAINQWRKFASGPESKAEIIKRVKSLLDFVYVYIRTMYYSNAPTVNQDKFGLPFEYYTGGVVLKSGPDADTPFAEMFNSKQDQETAMKLLGDAVKTARYPSKSVNILEIAEFMKILSGELGK